MRNPIIFAAAASLALLTGCTDAATSKREAGNWVNEVDLIKFEVPGMPPEMKESMRGCEERLGKPVG